MLIYKIINNVLNKYYIVMTTKTLEERFSGHKKTANRGEGFYLHSAMRKYGIENFSIECLDFADTIEELKNMEISYIAKYNTFCGSGYNLTPGGDFTSNAGKVVVKHKQTGILSQITTDELKNNSEYVHINKGMITIFKDISRLRVTVDEYKTIYYFGGWRSKNYGYTTVKIISSDIITKIKSEDFDKTLHSGVSSGTQTYYDSVLEKFVALKPHDVDLDIHFSKYRTKYIIYNKMGNIIQKKFINE